MPHKFETEKLRIPRAPGLDRRCKLTDEERAEIKEIGSKMSQLKLAEKFGVSRRLIQFILDPRKKAQNDAGKKARGRQYDKEKSVKAVQDSRRHKKDLHERGMLI